MKNTKKIVLFNNKGGIGKSTSTINIGRFLSSKGKKVLFVDLDRQCNLSRSCGYTGKELIKTNAEYIFNSKISVKNIILESKGNQYDNNIDIIVGSNKINDIDYYLNDLDKGYINNIHKVEVDEILKNRLEEINGIYDYIFIDLPPTINYLVKNALTWATDIFIPVHMEVYSLSGIMLLIDDINEIKNKSNSKLNVGGIFVNKFRNYRTTRNDYIELKKALPKFVLETIIYDRNEIKENIENKKYSFDKKNKNSLEITKMYEDLVKEMGI